MRDRLVWLSVLVAAAAMTASAATPAGAQGQPGAAPTQGPAAGSYEAGLDGLLAARDYTGLGRAVLDDAKDGATAVRALDWLQARALADGGSLISFLYSAALWRLSESVPEPDRAQLQVAAAAQYIVARWLILTEGFQCADATAPRARLAALDERLAPVARYFSRLVPAQRKQVLNVGRVVMLRGFKARVNDVWMCSGGTAHFLKYFEKHPDAKGKETMVPGQIGTTIELPADPSIVPDFVPYGDWQARRRAAIDKLVREFGLEPVTDYADASHRMR